MDRLRCRNGRLPPLPRTIQNPALRVRSQHLRLLLIRLKQKPISSERDSINRSRRFTTRLNRRVNIVERVPSPHAQEIPQTSEELSRVDRIDSPATHTFEASCQSVKFLQKPVTEKVSSDLRRRNAGLRADAQRRKMMRPLSEFAAAREMRFTISRLHVYC